MNKRPIGIFDSGAGGLTVVDKVFRLLPKEEIIYFGDTARVPYGNKSKETITRFSKEIINFLLGFKVKLIIAACNTVSSLSLDALKRSSPVPIIGVIKPGIYEALRRSKTKRIGVIGTEATISSSAYKNNIRSIDGKSFVVEKACPLFVPLVENMWLDDEITLNVAKRYLSPLLKRRIDSLILGCTHYPLLKGVMQKIVGRNVALIDSSMAVAEEAKKFLQRKEMLNSSNKAKTKFFTSDDIKSFERLARIFLNKKIKAEKVVF